MKKQTEQTALKIYTPKEVARAILFGNVDKSNFIKVCDFNGEKVGYYLVKEFQEAVKNGKKITF